MKQIKFQIMIVVLLVGVLAIQAQASIIRYEGRVINGRTGEGISNYPIYLMFSAQYTPAPLYPMVDTVTRENGYYSGSYDFSGALCWGYFLVPSNNGYSMVMHTGMYGNNMFSFHDFVLNGGNSHYDFMDDGIGPQKSAGSMESTTMSKIKSLYR
jgi:hypothetical protein